MIRKHIAAIAALAMACTLAGCAPVHRVDRGTSDKAKTFVPLTDKAVVYVYRNTIFGAAISMGVDVDTVRVGSTGPNSFFKLALPPGKHTLVSHAENTASLDIDVKAGERYYVWQDVKLGFFIMRTALHQVTDAEGEKEVKSLKLLRTDVAQFRMPEDGVTGTMPAAAPETGASAETTTPTAPTSASDTSPPREAAQTVDEPSKTVADVAPPTDATAVPSQAAAASPSASGGIAALDDRVSKPMFDSAQDVASRHQCERLLRVRSVEGQDAHFFSACPGTTTPIEIACHAAACTEASPAG